MIVLFIFIIPSNTMVSGGRRRKEEKEGPFRGDEN
jgi:hypothetical protein